MANLAGVGFDGVIAKRLDFHYASGEHTGMVKIKKAAHGRLCGRRFPICFQGRQIWIVTCWGCTTSKEAKSRRIHCEFQVRAKA